MKKALLYSVLALALITASAGGYIYYIINVKTYETSDKKVTKITAEEYKIDLPSDRSNKDETVPPSENTSTESDHSSTDSSSNSGQSASTTETDSESKAATAQPSAISNPNTHSQPKHKKVTVQQIKNNYRPVFESLQSQANGRLSALIGHAKSEYSKKKAHGEKIRIGYFVSKYKSAGENLETNTDQAFNTIYSALVNDLKRNGFNTKHASEFKTQYENEKEARRDSLFAQVKERL